MVGLIEIGLTVHHIDLFLAGLAETGILGYNRSVCFARTVILKIRDKVWVSPYYIFRFIDFVM